MLLGILAGLGASLCWALGVNVYSDLVKKYTPAAINFNRALVACPLFVLSALVFEFSQSQNLNFLSQVKAEEFLWLALSCLSSYALGDLLFFRSANSPLQVTGALSIASIYPIWSALGAVFFLGHAVGAATMGGLVLVVGGTIGVIYTSHSKVAHPRGREELGFFYSVLMAVFVSFLWASNTYAINQVSSLNAFVANAIRLAFALVLCPLIGKIILGTAAVKMSSSDFKKALPVFIFEGFGGSLLYVYGLSHTDLALGAVLTSLSPVLSVPIFAIRHRVFPNLWKSISIVTVVLGLSILLIL